MRPVAPVVPSISGSPPTYPLPSFQPQRTVIAKHQVICLCTWYYPRLTYPMLGPTVLTSPYARNRSQCRSQFVTLAFGSEGVSFKPNPKHFCFLITLPSSCSKMGVVVAREPESQGAFVAINIDVAFWGGVFSLHHDLSSFQRSRIILGFQARIVNIQRIPGL